MKQLTALVGADTNYINNIHFLHRWLCSKPSSANSAKRNQRYLHLQTRGFWVVSLSSPRELRDPMAPSSKDTEPKIVAEYSKSNRSSCKKCSTLIPAKALRLGIIARDSRGFDVTRWHHLSCFPPASLHSVGLIGCFNSLQSCDQEALKTLVETSKTVEDPAEESENKSSSTSKIKRSDVDEAGADPKDRSSKKSKANEAAKLEGIAFTPSAVMDHYKDAELLPHWKAFQTMIFLEQDDGPQGSSKVAAFDFDGCLAKTSVKRVGAEAWSLMYPSIPDKLQSLYSDGYKLVIFTNESNIDRWKNKRQVAVDSKIGRLNHFINRVKVPIQVFIACGYSDGKVEDPFRKPKPGMWHIMEKHFNSGISIDMDQSFYVGDAAGRQTDHSDADLKFAKAIGLKFYVPEDYFGA